MGDCLRTTHMRELFQPPLGPRHQHSKIPSEPCFAAWKEKTAASIMRFGAASFRELSILDVPAPVQPDLHVLQGSSRRSFWGD